MTYEEFLKTKELQTIEAGIDVDRNELNKNLFEFQKDIVAWALKKGKAAVFSDCGSGKTIIQMEFANQIVRHTGKRALIVAPLAVVGQTKREGEKFGIEINICREQEDVRDGINITNYEILEHFTASDFDCVVLDEAHKLSNNTSIRYRTIEDFLKRSNIPYVFLAMNEETNSERGVTRNTTSAIITFSANIKISVPSIVIMPVKSCVNPISSPSANWSTSAIIRLTISPEDVLSR